MFFPNESEALPDKIGPQVFDDLIFQSNGNSGFNFLKKLNKLLSPIRKSKVPELLGPFLRNKVCRPF